jgi:prepilin-type processing-associated H-X9-DG protein
VNNSNVSYFVGVDASESAPQMVLSGDDNWLIGGPRGVPVKPGLLLLATNAPVAWSETRHKQQGNVGLADGSVQGWSSSKLTEGLILTGVATNRFVFP